MHDPCTVAFDIKYPWRQYRPWPDGVERFDDISVPAQHKYSPHFKDGYRNTFITIWHVDPEQDGSDDSCGWCYPKLTKKQRERLKNLAWSESRYPYFLRCKSKEWAGTRHEAEVLYRGLVLMVADVLDIPLTFDDAARKAARVIHSTDCSDAADALCFKAGYHSNLMEGKTEHDEADDRYWRQDRFMGIACGIARSLLRDRRRWWRHPKWHIHHWKIQVHPLQLFLRWAFARCAKCGGRFKYGETPIGDWGGKRIWHQRCDEHRVATTPDAEVAQG